MLEKTLDSTVTEKLGTLRVLVFAHPQGCRSFLLNDPVTGQSLALDVHLDLVDVVAEEVRKQGWTLPYVVDSHTHADHPSGSAALAERFSSTRVAHESAGHNGVTRHPRDGDALHLGDQAVTVYHCPGHTPDHIVLAAADALFAGDTLLIGSVARTDFLGGDAGQLYDSIHRMLDLFPRETILYPSHDYAGRTKSTLGAERDSNPWLQIRDRAQFVRALSANPPPRPANMDQLLRMNRQGLAIPDKIDADELVERVRRGGASSIVDVRTTLEFQGEHIEGSVPIPLDQLTARIDEVRAVPAPRMILCRSGSRAELARRSLKDQGLAGLSVVQGGLEAYRRAGGTTERAGEHMSLERQVRIAAGSITLLGVVLGFAVHAAFFGLAGFIGAGLVFAGVTDWCGMGLLLARMPWNRAASAPETRATTGACSADAPQVGACAAQPPGF